MSENSTLDDLRQTTKWERYLIGVLCFVNIINYMDRIGIAAVLVTIADHFSIGDDLIGLLQTGLMIALTLSAPAFGFCGDRYSRKYLLIGCVCLWAISTVVGAFSKSYVVLLLSRVMVGLGQSGYTAITPTVISDVALRGARTVFLACFYIGIPIGAGLGYVAVASVARRAKNWSMGLCVGPCLCVIGVLLMAIAKFPKRGEKEAAEKGTAPLEATAYTRDIAYLVKVPSFCFVTMAFTQVAFYVGALSWWGPKCLYNGFQLLPDKPKVELEDVAFSFGGVTILTGVLGVLVGLLLSRLLRPRFPNADPLICGFSLLLAIPFITAALSIIAKSQILTFALIFFSEMNMNVNWALLTDMLLYVVIPTRRTSAQGINMLFGHGLGDCISPYIIGVLSEYFKRNFEFTNGPFFLPLEFKKPINPNAASQQFHALQMSLFILAIILVLGCLCFFATYFYIQKDREKVEELLATGTDKK